MLANSTRKICTQILSKKVRNHAFVKYPTLRSKCFSTLKFTSSHEYIDLDGDIGIIGITDHAAGALGLMDTISESIIFFCIDQNVSRTCI